MKLKVTFEVLPSDNDGWTGHSLCDTAHGVAASQRTGCGDLGGKATGTEGSPVHAKPRAVR